MASDSAEPIERCTSDALRWWSASLKAATPVAEAARRHGPTVAEIEESQEKFLV